MNPTVVDEQIRLCAKQLKIPTFAEYDRFLRQADSSASFAELLLELMKAECSVRQDNQMVRRLKAAAFPYQKTLEEFDYSQLNPSVSPLCSFGNRESPFRKGLSAPGFPCSSQNHLAFAQKSSQNCLIRPLFGSGRLRLPDMMIELQFRHQKGGRRL